MRKHGFTIIELLGAIVLFGIIASLSAMMISVITKANAKIVEQSRSNTEMTLLESRLDQSIRDLGPTNYDPCIDITDCIIFKQEFEYVPNLATESIDLAIYDPANTLKIHIADGHLYLNDGVIAINHFTLDPTSSLQYTLSTDSLSVDLILILVGLEGIYTFHYHQTLQILPIPSL